MQFSTLRDQRHGKPSWATCSKGHTIGVCLRERHHWCLLSIESEKKKKRHNERRCPFYGSVCLKESQRKQFKNKGGQLFVFFIKVVSAL